MRVGGGGGGDYSFEVIVGYTITFHVFICLIAHFYINEWKRAKVIPLHKKGDVIDVRNYRPISVLSTSSKIIERIAHRQFMIILSNIPA